MSLVKKFDSAIRNATIGNIEYDGYVIGDRKYKSYQDKFSEIIFE